MGSTSYTTGPIQGHTPLWSHLSCSTTSMRLLCIERTIRLVEYGLPTSSDPFLRPHTEGNRHAQEPTFRAPRATGNIRPTGQRHRPQLIHRNLQNQKAPTEQNPTLRQAIPVITKAKPSLFPSASPPISPRRSRCFRSPTPAPLQLPAPSYEPTRPQISSSSSNRFDRNRRTSPPKLASFPAFIYFSSNSGVFVLFLP